MRLVRTDESICGGIGIGAGGMRVGAMMNWVDGLDWGMGLGLSRSGFGGWGVSGVGMV